ncbi:MAG: DnaJ C-terminal domain-containing protein, partial [Rhodothermales bacterium]|nr:DnaJ C-terminal domain-containing protein [Rhodothermales bacterium]
DPFEAMLGTVRQVPNAYGKKIKVSVPAGTQPGERLRLAGQGVKTEKGKGDLIVEVNLHVPKGLTDEQRRILEEAAERAGVTGE